MPEGLICYQVCYHTGSGANLRSSLKRRSIRDSQLVSGVASGLLHQPLRYVVAFAKHPELTREFAFTQLREARAYLKHLRENHSDSTAKDPAIRQREDSILIRFRDRGFPEFTLGATSYEEAAKIVQQVEAERARGICIDYSRSLKISLAEVIDDYLEKKCPKHKGGLHERY